jgi:hypothetical protein
MLTHLIFDCWIFLDDVREDGSKAKLRQHLRDCHLLAIRVLQLEHVFCIWRHNDLRVVIEGHNQQQPERLIDFGVPLLAFSAHPENALLASRQLPTLLDEGLFLVARVLCGMPSTHAQSR